METCFNWCEPGFAYVSSDERKWINRIRKLAEEHGDDCVIMKQPEDNGGFIYAKVPQNWVRVRPPIKRDMTDEQRAAIAERMRTYRSKQRENADSDELEE